MNVSKANSVMGYGLMLVGAAKAILIILIFSKITMKLSLLLSGLNLTTIYFPTFSSVIMYCQIALCIGAMIMAMINYSVQEELVTPYLATLGAFLLDIIMPSILAIIVIFFSCYIYFKSGNTILRLNTDKGAEKRYNKKLKKRTEYFYSGKRKNKLTNQEQIELIKADIKNEIQEWKNLLDSGEIDLESYNQEIERLNKKAQKNNININ